MSHFSTIHRKTARQIGHDSSHIVKLNLFFLRLLQSSVSCESFRFRYWFFFHFQILYWFVALSRHRQGRIRNIFANQYCIFSVIRIGDLFVFLALEKCQGWHKSRSNIEFSSIRSKVNRASIRWHLGFRSSLILLCLNSIGWCDAIFVEFIRCVLNRLCWLLIWLNKFI